MIKVCVYCHMDSAGNHEKTCPNYIEENPVTFTGHDWNFSYNFEKFSKENIKLDRIIFLLEAILDRLEKIK